MNPVCSVAVCNYCKCKLGHQRQNLLWYQLYGASICSNISISKLKNQGKKDISCFKSSRQGQTMIGLIKQSFSIWHGTQDFPFFILFSVVLLLSVSFLIRRRQLWRMVGFSLVDTSFRATAYVRFSTFKKIEFGYICFIRLIREALTKE